MSTFSIHAFPMSQGPSCVLTHPQTCTNLWGKAVGVHSPVTWKTSRETREKTMHPRSCHIGHSFPAIFSQDISMLLILLHAKKTAYVLESNFLVLDSGHFGRALMSLQRLQL